MNDDKCEFCNGTGKEEGLDGCVWCFSTGTSEGLKMLSPPPRIDASDIERWHAMIAERPEGPWVMGNGGSFDRQGIKPISDDLMAELAQWLRLGYTPWNGRTTPLSPGDRQFMYLLYYSVQGLVSRVRHAEQRLNSPKCKTCDGNGVIGWTRGQTAESFEQGESPCEDCNATGYAHSNGLPMSGTCTTCNGIGTVPDGEIAGLDGVEFENGPIECIKDCPDCKPSAPVERDERAEFEAHYLIDHVFERADFEMDGDRYVWQATQDRWEAWQARAALERKP